MDKENKQSSHQSLGHTAEKVMKSCFEGHKRGCIYPSHKSPIICVILFLCSASPGGIVEKYNILFLMATAHIRDSHKQREELEDYAVPVVRSDRMVAF